MTTPFKTFQIFAFFIIMGMGVIYALQTGRLEYIFWSIIAALVLLLALRYLFKYSRRITDIIFFLFTFFLIVGMGLIYALQTGRLEYIFWSIIAATIILVPYHYLTSQVGGAKKGE